MGDIFDARDLSASQSNSSSCLDHMAKYYYTELLWDLSRPIYIPERWTILW